MSTRARWTTAALLIAVLVAAAGATAALRLIGGHALGPGGTPLSAAAVRREFARTAAHRSAAAARTGVQGGAQGGGPPASTSPAPSGRPVTGTFAASGGTVFASCSRDLVTLTGWIPEGGYGTGRYHRGPARTASVTFASDGSVQTVAASCRRGQPAFTLTAGAQGQGNGDRGGRHDGGGGRGGGGPGSGGTDGGGPGGGGHG